MFKRIKKRDGRIVKFSIDKITEAVRKAGLATGEFGEKETSKLTLKVLSLAQNVITVKTPTVEQIQDIVEEVLLSSPYRKTVRAYIIYREQHTRIREITAKANVDLMDQYLDKIDWQVNENSNMAFSLQGLNNYISSEVSKAYWLNKIYPPEIREAHSNSDFHIHDLGLLANYCVGWDLEDLLLEGFKGASGKMESSPAKHFRSALGQVVNFLYTLQGESAGAVAFSNFDTLLSPFIHYDKLTYPEVKQAMQEFIFNMNVPTRTGFQTPFSNITLDLIIPSIYADKAVIIGGKPQNKAYKEFQKEMDIFNRAFLEIMLEGDSKGRVFSFPIPTYNISRDFNWDNPKLKLLWEVTGKYGLPYFANFINSDMKPEDARSMCCRLRIDNRKLHKRGGGLFGANALTGSIGVVTINMPRLSYLFKTKKEFFARLDELMLLAKDSLEIKRKVLERFTDGELYPYAKFYLRNIKERFGQYWKNHFSTIGLVGMNEACLNLLHQDIGTQKGKEFVLETLNFMRDKLLEYQRETGNNYNLEATPAEGTSYRLARADKDKYPQIICANEENYKKGAEPFYTNCASEDTECLTEKGWRKYSDIKKGDLILTLNLETEQLEYQPVLYMNIQKLNKQKMYNIASKRQNQLITPNHRVLYDGNRRGKYQFATPKNLPHKLIIPTAGKYKPKKTIKISNAFIELIGWIITEGHFEADSNAIRITQAEWFNKEKFDEIKEVLKRLKIKFTIHGDKRGNSIFRICAESGKEIRKHISSKNIPRWCLNTISLEQMNLLLDTMMKGDGTISKNSSCYYVGDKKLADEFQELCVKTDRRGIISDYKKETGSYHIVPSRRHHTEITKHNVAETIYSGVVWCPTVNNGTWIARRNGKPFITGNSSQLAVNYTDDIFEVLDLQDDVQTLYTGGTVIHLFAGEQIKDFQTVKALVRKVCENYHLPYFTLTPTFSVCPTHGYIAGEHYKCSKCDASCEVYSRVVGFLRPVRQWNKGKKEEFKQRKTFAI